MAKRWGLCQSEGELGGAGNWPDGPGPMSSALTCIRGADLHLVARAHLPGLQTPAQHACTADAVGGGHSGPSGQPWRAAVIMEIIHSFIQQTFLEVPLRQGDGRTSFRPPSEPQPYIWKLGLLILIFPWWLSW